ncbi:MAG: SBBP repeat-containing protein, partial [Candidatus Sulfotelmatobacter sp.]
MQFRLSGATTNPKVVGEDLLPGKVNYFLGNNPTKWRTNVATYARVRYENVYPGIDLVYYGNHRQLEYDFVVSPGADPGLIGFEIQGPSQMQVDEEGNLALQTPNGSLHFQTPAIYQDFGGRHVPITGAYVVKDETHITFQVAHYDPSHPLVIDPVLVYGTYLGGSGDDRATGIAVDSTGSVYVAGYTDSVDFPVATPGSLPSGATHVFVAKLDATGSNLVYADYIGGNSQDYGYALVVDGSNNVYVTGSTASSDFPMVNPYQGTYPGSFNAFLTKISASGSSLLYSTYFGGNGSDIPSGLAIDSLNDVVLAGNTSSTNLPVVNAYQSAVAPNQGGLLGNYGFLTKFNPNGSSLVYSTYLGGNSNIPLNCGGIPCWTSPYTAISGVAVDSNGNAYVAGDTNTYNFPTTQGAYLATDTTQMNSNVGFVSKVTSSGSLDYSTYFYESSGILTNIDAIAVDGSGSAYVTGSAVSDGTFPVTSTSICDPGVYGWECGYAFVTKFDPTGSSLLYSTFLGPNNSASPQAIALDANNDVYVLATTSSNTFGIVNGIEPYTNGSDILLAEIDPSASTQLFATYLGGSGDDSASSVAVDSRGNVYIAGSTDSTDFPVTQGAFQEMVGGNTDA